MCEQYSTNIDFVAATIRVLAARGIINPIETNNAINALQAIPPARIATIADTLMAMDISLHAPEIVQITDGDYPPVPTPQLGSLHLLLVDA